MSETTVAFSVFAAVFLVAFLACFRPTQILLRAAVRLMLSGVALALCHVAGFAVGYNIVTLLAVAILGIPGFLAVLGIYAFI